MDQQQTLKLELISRLDRKEVSISDVQAALNVSQRSVERYLAAYRKCGVSFTRHGNKSRPPSNRISTETKTQICELIMTKYFDCNCVHASELLQKKENILVNPETLRRWLSELSFVKKSKKKRRPRHHRERMKQTGIMIQFDGSHHHWFDSQESVLIAGIDDADSDIPYGEFFEAEDTLSCLQVLRKIVEKKGIFGFLYTDNAGMFGGGKRHDFTQVKRALKELGITVITTSVPESKGRIERLWGTLQDRLVPELRLAGITSSQEATNYFNNVFLKETWGPSFKIPVSSESKETAYRFVPTSFDLDEIFCIKEHRTVKKDHTFSLDGVFYKVTSSLKHSIENQKLEIRSYPDKPRRVLFAGQPIEFERIGKAQLHEDGDIDLLQLQKLESLKVRQDGHVKYGKHYFSLGPEMARKHVYVQETKERIRFYNQGKLHVEYELPTKASPRVITLDHHRGIMEIALSPQSLYIQAARRLGPWVEKVIRILIEQGRGFLDEKSLWGVLKSFPEYNKTQLDKACKTAVEINQVNYKTIRILLRIQNAKSTPESPVKVAPDDK